MKIHRSVITSAMLMLGSGVCHATLVGQWNLEEGSGTNTTELVSGTPSAAFGTGVAWSIDTPGVASTATLSFPGTAAGNLRTNLSATAVGFNGSNAKTITAWFKAGDTAGTTRMFFGWSPTNGVTAGADLRLGLDGSGFLRFEVSGGFALYNTTALDDGAWHMVGVVIDANDNVNSVQFYIDGALVNPTSAGNVLINTTGTSADTLRNDIYLGIGNPGGTQHWNGLLDDMRIYDSALTEPELDDIMAAMAVAPAPPLVWTNQSNDGLWNTTSVNWNNGANLAFTAGDEVRFEDLAGSSETVSLVGTLEPEETVFANFSTNFALGGTGTLAGTGSVLINDGGYVTFSNGGGLGFSGSLSVSNSGLVMLGAAGNHGSTIVGASSTLELLNGSSVTGPIANSGQVLDSSDTGTVTLGGAVSGTGTLDKTDASTLALTAVNTFTGNTLITGGVLELGPAAGLYHGGYRNTSFLTVGTGATLRIAMFNYNAIGAGTGDLGGLPDYSVHRLIDGGTLEVTGASHSSGNDFQVSANGGTFRYSAIGETLSLDGNANDNIRISGPLVFDTLGSISVAEIIQDGTGSGSLTKTGASTLILGGANTYTGDTVVSAGTLTLGTGAQLMFVLGATSGVNNSISGAGTAVLNGNFAIDTTAAAALSTGSWTLENVASLTGAYGTSFTVVGFTDIGSDQWSKTDASGLWTFDETTGVLTLSPPAGYNSWATTNGVPGQAINLDHDNDGVSNGVEYFIGGPTGNTTGFTPLPGVTTTAGVRSITWTKAATYAGAYGTDFVVETSTTLTGAWTVETDPGNVTVSGNNVTYTFPAGPVKNFARLKVTGP